MYVHILQKYLSDAYKLQKNISDTYGVATISRMFKNIGLFCKRALQKRPVFCKETCIFKHPTHRSHPISDISDIFDICMYIYCIWYIFLQYRFLQFRWIHLYCNRDQKKCIHLGCMYIWQIPLKMPNSRNWPNREIQVISISWYTSKLWL